MWLLKQLALLDSDQAVVHFRKTNRDFGRFKGRPEETISKMRAVAIKFIPGVAYALEHQSQRLLKELLLVFAGNQRDFQRVFGRTLLDTARCAHTGSYVIALRKAFPEAGITVFDFPKMPWNYYEHHSEADLIMEGKIYFRTEDTELVKKLILNHFERSTIKPKTDRDIKKTLTRERMFSIAIMHLLSKNESFKTLFVDQNRLGMKLWLKTRINNFLSFQDYITGSVLHRRRYRRGQDFDGWQPALDYLVDRINRLPKNEFKEILGTLNQKSQRVA